MAVHDHLDPVCGASDHDVLSDEEDRRHEEGGRETTLRAHQGKRERQGRTLRMNNKPQSCASTTSMIGRAAQNHT